MTTLANADKIKTLNRSDDVCGTLTALVRQRVRRAMAWEDSLAIHDVERSTLMMLMHGVDGDTVGIRISVSTCRQTCEDSRLELVWASTREA